MYGTSLLVAERCLDVGGNVIEEDLSGRVGQ